MAASPRRACGRVRVFLGKPTLPHADARDPEVALILLASQQPASHDSSSLQLGLDRARGVALHRAVCGMQHQRASWPSCGDGDRVVGVIVRRHRALFRNSRCGEPFAAGRTHRTVARLGVSDRWPAGSTDTRHTDGCAVRARSVRPRARRLPAPITGPTTLDRVRD
jgi:hypothetical protein